MELLKIVAKSVVGQALGLAVFAGGFWLLYTGFQDSSIPIGVLGGVMIPLGMWIMSLVRRAQSTGFPRADPPPGQAEGEGR